MFNKKSFFAAIFVLLSAIIFVASSGLASAQANVPGIDLSLQLIFAKLYMVACWLWSTVLVGLIIFVVISGIRIMYAGGNATKVESAKTSFKFIILGSAVVLGTFIIVATIAYNIGADISYVPFDCQNISF